MKIICLTAFLFTVAPLSFACAQSTVTYVQPNHANPDAWRRNDRYMGNNHRADNAGIYNRSDRNRDDNGGRGRYRNGNAQIVNGPSNNNLNNNNRNNSQTNGVTITNIYSVPSNVSNGTGTTTTTSGSGAVPIGANAGVNTR